MTSCPVCRCDDSSLCPTGHVDSCDVTTPETSTGSAPAEASTGMAPPVDSSTANAPSGTSTGAMNGASQSGHSSLVILSLISVAIFLMIA